MMVQESGVAVGWPLNLGHSTTGWPLGLRLRLMHEDLEWPKRPDLARSSSHISTDSSSLDTTSTVSFFQDKSITLGALIGLPMFENAGNRPHPYQQDRPFLSAFTAPPSTRTARPVQTANNALRIRQAKSRLRHHGGHNSAKNHRQHFPPTPSRAHSSPSMASIAGWSLLSVLSCARVPAEIGSAMKEAVETSMAHGQLVPKQGHSSSFVQVLQDPELEVNEGHESTVAPTTLLPRTLSQEQCLNSLARKLYDNITFEDEESELSTKHGRTSGLLSSDGSSSELNPLFSSTHEARDVEENEENDDEKDNQSSTAMGTCCAQSGKEEQASCTRIPLVSLTRSSSNDSDAVLYYRRSAGIRMGCPTSTSFFLDVGKWQQKQQQLGHENPQQFVDTFAEHSRQFMSRPAHVSYRNRAISAFVSRMGQGRKEGMTVLSINKGFLQLEPRRPSNSSEIHEEHPEPSLQ